MTFSNSNLNAPRANVFVALGSNLNQPVLHVQKALRDLNDLPETELSKVSTLYETAPVGRTDQPLFVNAVARVSTLLSPQDFLARLQEIEAQHGRKRTGASAEKNAPRTLDLDILLFDRLEINDTGLIIPHPRMHERAFVLVPLIEIAPLIVIPGKGAAKDLLAALDTAGVARYNFDGY